MTKQSSKRRAAVAIHAVSGADEGEGEGKPAAHDGISGSSGSVNGTSPASGTAHAPVIGAHIQSYYAAASEHGAGYGHTMSGAAGPHATHGILSRLGLAMDMVDSTVAELQKQLRKTRSSNRRLASEYDPDNAAHAQSFAAEHTLLATRWTLRAARLKISGVASIHDIPETLLQALYAVRMSGTRLRDTSPECSAMLSEASIQLGSAILDAATISGSKLDLGRSNTDASRLFDQAKLTADSKLRKQYPKLGILGVCNRCY